MKYGLLMCKNTDNIGDDIQSYAAKRFLPRIDVVIDRESLDSFRLESGQTEPISVIMNAWYMHKKYNWPPAGLINPLFISMHVSAHGDLYRIDDRFLDGLGGAYLRRFEPIGARDESTLSLLEKKGIRAYFSGCLTLTLSLPDTLEKSDEVILTDVNPAIAVTLKKQFPGENWQSVTHCVDPPAISTLAPDERLEAVEALLHRYKRAKCVVTQRLHCALPCLALGTPVLLLYEEWSLDRMSSFLPLLNSIPVGQAANGRCRYNISSPPANPTKYLKYRHTLEERCCAFIREAEAKTDFPPSFPAEERLAWQKDLMSASLNTVVREREQNAHSLERLNTVVLEREQNACSLERELASIKGSVSFRLGRAITWLPRKIRGGVRCYRDHGGRYTAERILYHLHHGLDNEKRDR